MKKLMMVMLLTLCTAVVNAQNANEWFRQKETQIKYLLEQISALIAYGEVINKGYEIAADGLTAISKSRDGDFQQHRDYFHSLWKVKPVVKNYNKVFLILKMKAEIEKQFRLVNYSLTKYLDLKEKAYITGVYKNLISELSDLITELNMLVSDDQLELKDDERILRIDQIYERMQDCYEFSQAFANEVKLLLMNQDKETNELSTLRRLFGLK